MKKILAIILAAVMVFSLAACGEKETAETNCSSCGKSISSNATFCEHCGAAVDNINSENEDTSSDNSNSNDSAESGSDETSKPSSSKPSENSKPSANTVPNTSKSPSNSSGKHTHTIVIDKGVSPTCSTQGKTEGKHCSVCGEIIVAQKKLSIVAHNYTKGKCSMCGKEETHSLGLSYKVNFEKEYVIVTGIGTCGDTTVKIPSYQQGLPVKEIDSFAFYQTTTVKKVIIPETITKIGYRAFRESALEEIIIPDNVTEIGGDAFYGCANLTKISVPSTLKKLGYSAFGMCKKANFTNYENCMYLGNEENPYLICFGSINYASTIKVHDKARFISYAAFAYDEKLKNLYLPEGIIDIAEGIIIYCKDVTVHYAGTKQQWENIRKHDHWNLYATSTLICKDGPM